MLKKILIFVLFSNFSRIYSSSDENPCKNVISGIFPHSEDCSSFLTCHNQEFSIEKCADGEIFDKTILKCVQGDSKTCKVDKKFNSCPEIDDPLNPVFIPHPTNCAKYFFCFDGSTIERECSNGFYWNSEKEWCDYPENVNCNVQTVPRPPYCNDWINCPRDGSGKLPNLNFCHRYFECVMAVRFLRTCPRNQIFDVTNLKCDYPENSLCAMRDAQCIP